jgi:RNA polymerase sigma-70 factor, ECF subfamily
MSNAEATDLEEGDHQSPAPATCTQCDRCASKVFDAERFLTGDRTYVRHVMEEHSPMVMLVCESYARDYDHAQDLYQETWRAVCRSARSYRGPGAFATWLHRVASNVCRSDHRASRTMRETLERWGHDLEPGAWAAVDPLVATARRELHRVIHRALPELSDGEREALTLRVLEGRGPGEVASMMGVAPATVRSHIRHALNRLRQMMEDPGHELSRYRSGS